MTNRPTLPTAAPKLSRLLKRNFLRSFMQDAAATLPEGCFVAVVDHDKVLAAAGDLPPDTTPDAIRGLGCTSTELTIEETVLGFLLMGPGETCAGPSAKLIGRSLQEILAREHLSRALGAETLDKYREVGVMQRAVVHLNNSMKLRDVVQALLDEIRDNSLPNVTGMIFLMDDERERYSCLGSFGAPESMTPEALTRTELFEDIIQSGKGEIINDLGNDPRWNNEIPELTSLLMIPLRAPRLAMGALVLAGSGDTAEKPLFQASHLKKNATLASVAGTSMANAFHFEQVQHILMALMQAMATAIDARDRCTAGHSQRVAQYSLGLAQAANEDKHRFPDLRMEENDMQEIFYAGLLHDVGKIGIREEVLTKKTRLPTTHMELIGLRLALWGELTSKPWQDLYARFQLINKAYDLSDEDVEVLYRYSRETLDVAGSVISILTEDERDRLLTPRGNLSRDEWEEIKRHPAESHRILRSIPFTAYFPNLLTMVAQHHERLDGSGYPYATKSDEIIFQSRILAIVDIYDALRKDRHYKKALPREMALKILRQEAQKGKLDANLVDLFCERIETLEKSISVVDMDILSSCELIQ